MSQECFHFRRALNFAASRRPMRLGCLLGMAYSDRLADEKISRPTPPKGGGIGLSIPFRGLQCLHFLDRVTKGGRLGRVKRALWLSFPSPSVKTPCRPLSGAGIGGLAGDLGGALGVFPADDPLLGSMTNVNLRLKLVF